MEPRTDDRVVDTYQHLNLAQTVATLARRAAEATTKPVQGQYKDAAPFLVLLDADGKERVEWLKERLDDPRRKHGTVRLNDAESFMRYFAVHGSKELADGTPIYGSLKPASFVAVLNDHTRDRAGWRDHRAAFTLAYSPEWAVWEKHDRQPFNGNEAFALFIEENAPDFVKPDAADMLRIALNFRVRQGIYFDSAARLEDGNVDFTYRNTVQAQGVSAAGSKLRIPEQFALEVRIWDGLTAKKYKVEARFRYRLADGKLVIWYELVRPKQVIERAFKDVWDEIERGTKAKILYGSPEA